MNKFFMGLLGSALGVGALVGGNAASGSDWSESIAEWSFEQASEYIPFLEDFEDTWFGNFIQQNWTTVAGGLAAYIAAPDSLKGVVGFVSLGMLAWNMFKQYFPEGFNSEARGQQEPQLSPAQRAARALAEQEDGLTTEITAVPPAEDHAALDPARLQRAERVAARLNDGMYADELTVSGSGNHGMVTPREIALAQGTELTGDEEELELDQA